MKHHHLRASPETCHWGFFEAKLRPVLTIESGDEITVDTISGGPEVVPDRSQFYVPPELDEVHAKSERMVPGHILTGPVAIAGAEPGDVLEVNDEAFELPPETVKGVARELICGVYKLPERLLLILNTLEAVRVDHEFAHAYIPSRPRAILSRTRSRPASPCTTLLSA